jgi:hypothetical protein
MTFQTPLTEDTTAILLDQSTPLSADDRPKKTCPFCAEEILEAAITCRFCKADLAGNAIRVPRQGQLASCSTCKVTLVPVQKSKTVSAAGLFSVLLFLIGLVFIFGSPVIGILILILAVIIGAVGRGHRIVMVCPQCGQAGATL